MSQNYQTSLLYGEDSVKQAVSLLQKGECVALPTETVYGLAADASDISAVNKIFEAKGRPKNHPLIVHIPDVSQLENWAKAIPNTAYDLAKLFWPGPLSLLLKKAEHVPYEVTGGLDTIVLRVPAHPLFLDVLRTLNSGLAAPSANRYKQLSPTIAKQVMQGLDGRIAAVLEGGACEHGLESTILDLVSEKPRILRAGPVTQQQLEAAMGQIIDTPKTHIEIVPGNVEAHYQPNTPLRIMSSEQLLTEISRLKQKNCHFVVWSDAVIEQSKKTHIPSTQCSYLGNDATNYGRELYVTLYQVDQTRSTQIIVEQPPQSDTWAAVNDRLLRAAQ
ncbi:MAG: L-threonylcarbamoyladenylate synthase [Oleiphilaceae bacterium]|jgi:L-threonylcarbamoyladenylate synthase